MTVWSYFSGFVLGPLFSFKGNINVTAQSIQSIQHGVNNNMVVWKNLSSLHRTLTLSPTNIFKINYNARPSHLTSDFINAFHK